MKSPQLAKDDSEVDMRNKLFCGYTKKLSRLPLSIYSGICCTPLAKTAKKPKALLPTAKRIAISPKPHPLMEPLC